MQLIRRNIQEIASPFRGGYGLTVCNSEKYAIVISMAKSLLTGKEAALARARLFCCVRRRPESCSLGRDIDLTKY